VLIEGAIQALAYGTPAGTGLYCGKGDTPPAPPSLSVGSMSEIAFLRANIFNRKAGHNLIAGVAYRLGIKLTDWNTGIAHDFTRKSGIIHRAIFLPRQTKYKSLEELLADGERKERQSNSRVGRELLVAIPHELPQEQQIDLAKEFALEVQKRYGCAVIMSLHQADRNGDQRNVHAHIVMTTREIGEDGYLGAKIHQMDKRGEIDELKKLWEQTANKYLSPEGKHIKFESNLDKGKYPSLHLGRKATNFERKTGQKSDKRLAYESDIAEWESEVVKVKTEIEQKQLELAIKTIKKRVSQNPQYNSGNLILDVAERLEHFGLAKGINRNILQQKLEAPTTQEGFQKADPLRTPDQERLERWLKEVKEAVKVPPADRTEQEIFRRVLSEYPNASYLGWGEIYTQEIQAALEEAKKAEAAAKEAQAKAEREAEREKQRADQAQRQLQDLERQLAETREKLRAATTTAAQVPDLEKDKATLEAEITQKNQELATLRKQLEQVTTTASAEKTSLQQQIHQLTQSEHTPIADPTCAAWASHFIGELSQEPSMRRHGMTHRVTVPDSGKAVLYSYVDYSISAFHPDPPAIAESAGLPGGLANLQAQRTEAEFQKKYSYFASIKKLVNRYKNPQIGTDREGEILLPDQTLKFSELNGYSLESLQEVYQTTRRKIERDLERRIGQLPPVSRQIIGLRPLKELQDDALIELFPRVLQLEQSKQAEQQKQEAERKRLEQELERRRQEQERQQQELARAKLAKFKQTQKLLSLSGLGETGENWYRFENLLITEEKLREFPLEELEKIYQTTSQLALKKFQELAAKFWNDGEYDRRVWEIHERNLPLENKLEELLKIRDAVVERSFREINFYLGAIQQFRKDFRIDLDLAKIPKEEIADIARSLEETYLFYAKKYANLQEAISTCYLDQVILDFLIRKFELNPSEKKLKELLTGKEVKEVGEIQRKIAKSLRRKFSAETGEEPKNYDFDGLIWDYRVKVSEIQERLIRKLQSKGLETLDLETSDLEKLAGQVKEILKGEREKRKADRKRKLFFRSDRSPRRQREDEWGR